MSVGLLVGLSVLAALILVWVWMRRPPRGSVSPLMQWVVTRIRVGNLDYLAGPAPAHSLVNIEWPHQGMGPNIVGSAVEIHMECIPGAPPIAIMASFNDGTQLHVAGAIVQEEGTVTLAPPSEGMYQISLTVQEHHQ